MANRFGRWTRPRTVLRRVVGLLLVLLSTSLSGHLLLPHLLHLHSVTTCDYLRSHSLQPACALIQLWRGRKTLPVHSTSQRVRFAGVQHRVDEFKDEQADFVVEQADGVE